VTPSVALPGDTNPNNDATNRLQCLTTTTKTSIFMQMRAMNVFIFNGVIRRALRESRPPSVYRV